MKRETKAEIVRAYRLARMIGAAMCGKLGALDQHLPDEEKSDGSAALLGALLKMKRKGVPMTIERVERAA